MNAIEKLAEEGAVVGEGPLWNTTTQTLMWTDIEGGKLFEFDPRTGANTQVHEGFNVGGLVRNRQGGYLLFTYEGVVLWKSDAEWRKLHTSFQGEVLRFNDVIGAPGGRAFGGTYYPDKPGKLYRFDPDGTIQVVGEGYGCSNGMGFSPDLRTMYHTDAATREIYAYDYEPETGRMSHRRVLVRLAAEDGVPDGMTVDAEGFLWSANWFGGCIIRFDPDGREERRIPTPAKQTSCVTFGGKDLDELYFTTASVRCEPGSDLDPVGYDWEAYGHSYRGGGLFRIKLGIQGREEFQADFAWPL